MPLTELQKLIFYQNLRSMLLVLEQVLKKIY